ncbi:hypothetical protein AVEN_120446-1 [Araneus ventricosus]|uniref:Uncharacterized protein n=1 Tax=Araneus ventricosus TaxID=182803 RepID=A0A4Y2TMV8_ARAVE|nr:hypothetical protein AVEN_120446-1 [Araneus ventricosus]
MKKKWSLYVNLLPKLKLMKSQTLTMKTVRRPMPPCLIPLQYLYRLDGHGTDNEDNGPEDILEEREFAESFMIFQIMKVSTNLIRNRRRRRFWKGRSK